MGTRRWSACKDHKDARKLVDERFGGMHIVHTNNNLCLIVFGLIIGGRDIVKGLSETVAMGLDSDCTSASAGSIFGAVLGKKNIPEYLYKRFNNTIDTYLIGKESFHFDDMTQRFMKLTKAFINLPGDWYFSPFVDWVKRFYQHFLLNKG